MSFFCLLWIPFFYFARRPVSSGESGKVIWILAMGCAAAVTHYFSGDLFYSGGFGLSRWMSGFVNFTGLPVLIPFAVCMLLIKFRLFPQDTDSASFILIWLIPSAVYRSISWNSPGFPVFLVLIPLLWTAQAVGIPFFTSLMIKYSRRYFIAILLALCLLTLPAAAATCWWAFYRQQAVLGFILLLAAMIPSAISIGAGFSRKAGGKF